MLVDVKRMDIVVEERGSALRLDKFKGLKVRVCVCAYVRACGGLVGSSFDVEVTGVMFVRIGFFLSLLPSASIRLRTP